jgi:hypothetical protein
MWRRKKFTQAEARHALWQNCDIADIGPFTGRLLVRRDIPPPIRSIENSKCIRKWDFQMFRRL